VLLSSSGEKIVGDDANLFQIQIPKPVRRFALFNGLLKIIGKSPIQPIKPIIKPFNKSVALKHPLRILLAEDNVVNQKVGLLMLSRLGYNAHLAADGLRALNAVEDAQYDLILMDIQMPNMNGIEAARLIREKLGAKCPSICALTAEALEGDKERFLALGFDSYMSKPLHSQTLQEMLTKVKNGARNAL
jgi:CheY-like chemotaxis protein